MPALTHPPQQLQRLAVLLQRHAGMGRLRHRPCLLHYSSAVVFGTFEEIDGDKVGYLETVTEMFIPGRVAELRASNRREIAATMVLRLPITADNWSLKIGDGWPEDPDEDVAAGGWAGVVPIIATYGTPMRAPDCDESIPVPDSVLRLSGEVTNRRR